VTRNPHRADEVQAFIHAQDWQDATQLPLAGDASNRKYIRLIAGEKRAIVMDAAPEVGENVEPFFRIAGHLAGVGLSAPAICAQDMDRGLLLIEDLGDDLFSTVTARAPERERDLYLAATDTLIALHAAPPPPAPDYGTATMTEVAGLAHDWYFFGATGTRDGDARQAMQARLSDAFARLDPWTPVLVLRDYHAENLLWLPDRTAPANVGLLDFQDGGLGHPAYDLMSLARDVRRAVSPETTNAMIAHYARETGTDPEGFSAACSTVSAQRNLRILGVFARLSLHYGKPHYVDLIPRTWANLLTDLAHPSLAHLRDQVRATLPEPTPETLALLKEKCGTVPTR
jgi:aminoglycoside/choline kinase family phosphotransferase